MRAVIDIGSNSVRLLIEGDSYNKDIISTHLGESSLKCGILSSLSIDRTLKAVKSLVEKAKLHNVEEVYIFATEAVRAAKNGKEFCNLIKKATNIAVDVIDGDSEAQIGYLGSCSSYKDSTLLVDIGGASIEIICGSEAGIIYKKSLPLGTWRIKEECGDNRINICKYLSNELINFGNIPNFTRLIGIGGTCTSLAAMALKLDVYDPRQVDNYCLEYNDLVKISDTLYSSQQVNNCLEHNNVVISDTLCSSQQVNNCLEHNNVVKISDTLNPSQQVDNCLEHNDVVISDTLNISQIASFYPSLSNGRIPIIKQGTIALIKIMEYVKMQNIYISEKDNLEGYLRYKN